MYNNEQCRHVVSITFPVTPQFNFTFNLNTWMLLGRLVMLEIILTFEPGIVVVVVWRPDGPAGVTVTPCGSEVIGVTRTLPCFLQVERFTYEICKTKDFQEYIFL